MVSFTQILPVLALLAGAAQAHTRVWGLSVNDVEQGDGRTTYIRSPPSNSPVKDVSSEDIICNVANTAAPSSVSANAGDKITFEWYHDNRGDDIIDASHKGPITVYIADAASNGKGAVWTKIAEEGLSSGTWAVQTLIANKGKHSVTLPASLAPGDYLLRAEIIALHESDTDYTKNAARGAQFYPSCSQITVKSGGSTAPPGTFNFIGGYSPEDPGILFNLYGGSSTYEIPGPEVWTGGAGSGSGSGSASTKPAAPASTSKAATSAAAPVTSKAAAPVTSKAAAPVTSEAAAPVTSKAAAPTTVASPAAPATTKVATTAPANVPTTLATKTRTTAAAAPTTPATGGSGSAKTPESINKCLDEVNQCIAQAQSKIGGASDFSACDAKRAACY